MYFIFLLNISFTRFPLNKYSRSSWFSEKLERIPMIPMLIGAFFTQFFYTRFSEERIYHVKKELGVYILKGY